MSLRLESQKITPQCRENRGTVGAWEEAVQRLQEIYEAQVAFDPTVTMTLAIERGES